MSGEKKLGLDKIGLKFLSGNIVNCDKRSYFFFYNNVYGNLETVRSYSDKGGIKNKQKSSILLISANNYSLCLNFQTCFL